MSSFAPIQAGWVQKRALNSHFPFEYRRRYLLLTDTFLHYFHDEPSPDLVYIKGTKSPLLRTSFELTRIHNVEVIGEKQHKFSVFVDDADVKGHHDEAHVRSEYTFRLEGDSAQCFQWRDNIIKARDALVATRAATLGSAVAKASAVSSTLAAEAPDADPHAVIQQGWMEKLARDSLFEDWRKRYVYLTYSYLNYFHDEPSADLEFVKGTETPLLRRAIELNRIVRVEIYGVRNHKMKVFVAEADVKGRHDDKAPPAEYSFRISGHPEQVMQWRDNILRARDLYVAKLYRMTHFHGRNAAPTPAESVIVKVCGAAPDAAEVVQQGWMQKLARGSLFQDYRKRYLYLTHQFLHYFHDEPSDDLMFIKGTNSPLLRTSFELNRIKDVEVVGKNQHKIKVYVQEGDVKNRHAEHPVVFEYTFRSEGNPELCLRWRDNILQQRDAYLAQLAAATQAHK